MARKFKIKRGDRVVVRSGKDRGKIGEVVRVLRERERVVVQGVNMATKHQRPRATSPGGIQQIEASIHVSNVALIDPKTNTATRVGLRTLENGRKVRFAKRSGEVIDR
jgi:large subunit ribosomal protein L24